MKKQTFIAIIKDNTGKEISFERFSCKRADTVKNNMVKLFNNDLYKACMKNAATVEIYSTTDGYNRDPGIVDTFTV